MIYCRNDAQSNRSERKEEVAGKRNCTNSTVSIAGRYADAQQAWLGLVCHCFILSHIPTGRTLRPVSLYA